MKLKFSQSKKWREGYISFIDNKGNSLYCIQERLDWWWDYVNKCKNNSDYEVEEFLDKDGEVYYVVSEK